MKLLTRRIVSLLVLHHKRLLPKVRRSSKVIRINFADHSLPTLLPLSSASKALLLLRINSRIVPSFKAREVRTAFQGSLVQSLVTATVHLLLAIPWAMAHLLQVARASHLVRPQALSALALICPEAHQARRGHPSQWVPVLPNPRQAVFNPLLSLAGR